MMNNSFTGLEIAVIGMAGRFPGADSVEVFWLNLEQSVESIATLTDEEITAQGVDKSQLQDSHYVKAGGVLKDIDRFDSAFFGYSPKEADLLDPQQRLFLECAWQALETAGYDAESYDGSIGVYGGTGMNGYLFNLYRNRQIRNSTSPYELFIASDKDFLTTRVSYKLNLTGPSLDLQTACSTSLVAVHLACQSLISGECDIALAGGVAISKQVGYRYQEGGLYSPDGHCRAFDADAQGTVGGNGVGLVVLKRLEDALQDGDTLDAVIKGSAINNDGAFKVSYTAPRIDTQAAVIQEALMMAEVNPESIDYIEAHGTGTALGDPIEVAALTQAFRQSTTQTGFCALGSVKSNIGHLDAAAGIASLIKTIQALKHRKIPASLSAQQPNPNIDWENSPFYVNTELRDWLKTDAPRRAGVSSFGIGGTNAHIILEEAPQRGNNEQITNNNIAYFLPLSAKTGSALNQARMNLGTYLEEHSDLDLADVSYTLKLGRRGFKHCHAIVCQTQAEAIALLKGNELPPHSFAATYTHQQPEGQPPIVFMFSGQGSQYAGMAQQLYEEIPAFRQAIDHCCEIWDSLNREQVTVNSFLDILFEKTDLLNETAYAQPAIFTIDYALAQLWMSWGLQPEALIGHSLGEYVAACVAGVFSLEEGLRWVARRGRLMQQMAPGAMLSVGLSPVCLQEELEEGLEIAAINAPALCVVSGEPAKMATLQAKLEQQNIPCEPLNTSHAFHSVAIEPILHQFRTLAQEISLAPPQIPIISNVTGDWLTSEDAIDPDYWVRHLRQPVQFAQGLQCIGQLRDRNGGQPTTNNQQPNSYIFLEVGPGKALYSLAKTCLKQYTVIHSLPHPQDSQPAMMVLQKALAQLWTFGAPVNWRNVCADQKHRRIPLPTYPFERQRHWIEPDSLALEPETPKEPSFQPLENWFYVPSWQRSTPVVKSNFPKQDCWLVFVDELGIGEAIAQRLQQAGQDVFTVTQGEDFQQVGYRQFSLNPERLDRYQELLEELRLRELLPSQVIHLWSLNQKTTEEFEQAQTQGFLSLLSLAQSFVAQPLSSTVELTMISDRAWAVMGNEVLNPSVATIQGLAQVLGQEYPEIGCRQIDLDCDRVPPRIIEQVWEELLIAEPALVVAYRGQHRWQQLYTPITLPNPTQTPEPTSLRLQPEKSHSRLKHHGCYLIMGDLEQGLGLVFAKFLSSEFQAKLILVSDASSIAYAKAQWATWNTEGAELLCFTPQEQSPSTLRKTLQEAIEAGTKHFGSLNGVFFSAPTTHEKSAAPVTLLTLDHWHYNCESKVYPLQALVEVLQGQTLDFCCIQSSLSSMLGGLGLAAYAGVNCFVDALVEKQNLDSSTPWFAINWDACLAEEAPPVEGFGSAIAAYALTPQEVWEATKRILEQLKVSQVAVSKVSLRDRLRDPDPRLAVTDRNCSDSQPEANRQTRPQNLDRAYVPPSSKTEEIIAKIFQEVLGVQQVSIHDSFFDLGGHSLLAIQVISRLRDAFHVELEMRSLLFEAPTVASIAAKIDKDLHRQEDLTVMAELLSEVQGLSDEEIEEQL